MESRWIASLPSVVGMELDIFGQSELLRKAEYYSSAESNFHDQIISEESLRSSSEALLPETSLRIASATNDVIHEFSLGTPSGRYLRRTKTHSIARHNQSDLSLPSSMTNRRKRQRIDNGSMRSSSPTKSEFSALDNNYCLNSIICDDSECEIPPCREPGCDGNDMIVCNYGEECTAPAACSEDCFDRRNARSISPRPQWTLSKVKRNENTKFNQTYSNTFTSYIVTPTSPPPTTPLLSNISTIYSPHAELPTPKGPFSPGNSYQDPLDINYGNSQTYFRQSTRSTSCNGFDQSWSNPEQFLGLQDEFTSFQCPWLDCSRVIETCEQWNKHFHQEHIDPQMVYTCPLQTESCPTIIAANSLAHLESDHGFNISPNDENGYRCPSDTCQQSMEFFDHMSFHDHMDTAHATPSTGQLQCRLWACGNWFDDPNDLVSHAMQNHRIPVWSKQVDDKISTPEPSPLSIQTGKQDQIDRYSANEIDGVKLRSTKEIYNHQLSLRLQKSETHDSNKSSTKKSITSSGVERYTSHTCLWLDSCGIICGSKCASENELQNHLKESHLEILDNKTGYYCRWDGCTREVKLGLRAGFTQRGKLERHMATHTNFKCSTCDICKVSFSAPQAMRQHRRLHTGERPWKCQHCDKTFTQQSACTVHERTHTNEKPLECPICLKRFSESSNLTKHRKTHGEKGAHVCTYPRCGKTFHRYDQLKRHLLSHSNGPRSATCSTRGTIKDETKKTKPE